MRRALPSIVSELRTGGSGQPADRHLNSRSEISLIRRVLSFPMVERKSTHRPDVRLVELASALLEAHASRQRYFSPELFEHPAWTLILLVYVGQGQKADIAINSLCESTVIGPITVTLRWTAKLLNDDILQLAQNESLAGNPILRVSPEAMKKLEDWLRLAQCRLGSSAPAGTS